jgi:hypothetical protein
MTLFIERFIQDLVKAELQKYIDQPLKYERFLIEGGLEAEEAEHARARFVEFPPAVIQGFARTGGTIPCYAITLGSDDIAQDYIGEDAEMLDEDGDYYRDETEEVVDPHVRSWTQRFDIYIYSDHPDECVYLYRLLKKMLVGKRKAFHAADFDEVSFSGADLALDPHYAPADLWTRRFSVTLRTDEDYAEELEANERAEIDHVDAAVADGEAAPDDSLLTDEEKAELAAWHGAHVTTYTAEEG